MKEDIVRRATLAYTSEVNKAYTLYSEQMIALAQRKTEIERELYRQLDDARKSLVTNLEMGS